jgi:hypothetical protein
MLITHLIRESNEKSFALQLFISVLCFFALINIINPDAFIARENIRRFDDTGKLDTSYLAGLSQDATPVVAGLLNNSNKAVQRSGAYILYRQNQSAVGDGNHWQSTNLARQQADRIYRDNRQQIDATKSLTAAPLLNSK